MKKSYLVLIVVFAIAIVVGGVYFMSSSTSPELSPADSVSVGKPINMLCSGSQSCSSLKCTFKLQIEAGDGWRDAPGGVTSEGKRYDQSIRIGCEGDGVSCACGAPPTSFSVNGKNYRYWR